MSWFDDNQIDTGIVGPDQQNSGLGTPANPVYGANGAIDWSQTSTGFDQYGNPSSQAGILPQGQAASAGGGFDRTQFRNQSMARPVGQTAADFIAQHQGIAQGVTSYQGSKDKVVLPTGEILDLSINSDASGHGTANGWTGLGVNAQGVPDQPGGGGYGGGGSGYGSYSSSQGGTTGGGPVTMPTAPTYTPFTYTGAAPSYTDFVAPTAVTEQNDPGYQFRAQQQQQALDNSAAAKGMSHTNNTWQALQDQSGQLASQEYGNVYNRALGTSQTNNAGQLAAQQANYGQQFNANQALNAGQLANYSAQANTALGLGNLNLGYQNSANSYSLGQGNLALGQGNLALNQAGQSFNQGLALDQNAFGQQFSLAQLGNPGAPNSQGYGTTQGNTLEGQGNALASGTVGSANAYNGALGQLGNTAQQAAYLQFLQSQGKTA